MNNNLYTYIFKYIIVGDSNVGKSCILSNFLNKEFKSNHDVTIGVDFGVKIVEIEDKNIIKLYIWDTAGQETFKSIIRSYYRGTIGVLLIYDINNYNSYLNILEWMKEIKSYTIPEITFILIGNKLDLDTRCVPYDEAQQLADSYNMLFIETSAKESININKAFIKLTNCIYKKIIDNKIIITNTMHGIKIGTYNSNSNLNNLHVEKCINC